MRVPALALAGVLLCLSGQAIAGEISGQLLTPRGEWQSHIYHSCSIEGTNNKDGYGTFTSATGLTGIFYHPDLGAGTYSFGMSEKDHFNVVYRKGLKVPAKGNTWEIIQYDPTAFSFGQHWFHEWNHWYAQSFRATGENVISIGVRTAGADEKLIEISIHDGDNPDAPQIGPTRTTGTSITNGRCAYWSAGEVPTVPGKIYTVKLRQPNGGRFSPWRHALMDFMRSDNPDGRTWADGVEVSTPLEMAVNQDDKGLINTMVCGCHDGKTVVQPRPGFVGQTFTAKGRSVLMVTWLGGSKVDGNHMCAVSIHDGIDEDGKSGKQIGPTKYCNAVYWDGRSVVTFSPGEVPTEPGRVYFLRVEFFEDSPNDPSQVYKTTPDANYPGGDGYISNPDGTVKKLDRDLTFGVYEEKLDGSLDQPKIEVTDFGVESITPTSAVVKWTTNVRADSRVDYGETTPYPMSVSNGKLSHVHSVTLTGLKPNTMYHVKGVSQAKGARGGRGKDMVFVTAPAGENLLANAGFEASFFCPWFKYSLLDYEVGEIEIIDEPYHFKAVPRSGSRALAGAGMGEPVSGGVYQCVAAVPGREYRLSAWIWNFTDSGTTTMLENINYMRIGIDPTGGADPTSESIVWTPITHSQKTWTQIATSAVAQSSRITVFLYGGTEKSKGSVFVFDDVVLTAAE